jgi:CheY-like chemotaxis protein
VTAPSLLIVEDHDELRTVIQELLEADGYVVRCARDAAEALVILRTMPRPCLVLWDPVSHRMSLSLLAQAALDGIHIATIPIGIAPVRGNVPGSLPRFTKRLTSNRALMTLVKEHCPQAA